MVPFEILLREDSGWERRIKVKRRTSEGRGMKQELKGRDLLMVNKQ